MSNNASPPPSEDEPSPPQDLSASGLTIPSDSEAFSSLSPPSTSPPQSSSNNNNNNNDNREQKVVIYSRPTFWSLVRGAAINLLLPFVNGMMLGLGELLAHEIAFRWGWGTTQVSRLHDWRAGQRSCLWRCYFVGISSGTSSPCDGKQVDIFPHGLDISETQIIENSRPRRRDARRPRGKAEEARRHRP
jgi:hypothetical protein